jgi:RHS repeat-associated protein
MRPLFLLFNPHSAARGNENRNAFHPRWGGVIAIVCFAGLAAAQVNPGTPSFSAYDSHLVDTVNLQNLNVLLNLPVMNKSGAFPFSASLVGGDSYFSYNGTSLQPGILAQPITPNVSGILSPFGYTQVFAGTTTIGVTCPSGDGTGTATKYSQWYLQMTDGTVHSLPSSDVAYGGASCSSTLTDQVTDGSGWTVTVVGGTYNAGTQAGVTVVSSGGLTIDIATATIQDAQSTPNEIRYNSQEFFDTLGAEVMTVNANAAGQLGWFDVNGGNPTESQTFTSATLKTSFGCSGKADYPATAYAGGLTTDISFPDSTNLALGWEHNQVTTADYTGRLAKITLRAGGTITYNYNPSNAGAPYNLNCTYLVPNSMTRTTSDGTTKYTWAPTNNGSGNWGNTTVVTDNVGNQAIYTFTGLTSTGNAAAPVIQALTEIQHYQGGCPTATTGCNGGGTLLTTDTYCYNGASSGCPTAVVSEPITEVDVYHTIPNLAAGSSRTQTQYDGGPTGPCASGHGGCYGNVTASAQYDFGATTATVFTTTTYGSWNGTECVAVSSTINNKPCQVQTLQGGNTVTFSRFTYSSAGNLLTSYVSPNGGSTFLSNPTANVYNSNGTISTSYDLAGNATTYAYSSGSYTACGSCTNFPFPTSITKGVLTTTSVWNGVGGVKVSDTDANHPGNTTNYCYTTGSQCTGGTADPFWRVITVTDPLGNVVTNSYPNGSAPDTVSSSFPFNSGNSIQNTIRTTDGYGRTTNIQTQQSPTSTNYDTVSTQYGWSSNYRTVATSLPCTTTSGGTCSTAHTNYFDPLGRLYQGVTNSNETVTNTFTQNDVLRVLSPAPANENNKQVQNQYDGLGRLTSSCKISSVVTGNVSCAQNTNTSAMGVLTTTSYTSTTGSQTVSRTRGAQTRSETLDGLGRVTSSTTPEGGTVFYYYDTPPSFCNAVAVSGKLIGFMYANGNTSCYLYDSLGRTTLIGATSAAGTVCRRFAYDNSTGVLGSIPNGISISNPYGRMVEAETDNCSVPLTPITDEWFSYDKDGNKTDIWELTPHSTQYYHSTATFAGNRQVTSLVLASPSIATETYGLDGEGRWSSLASGTTTIVSGTTYTAASQPNTIALGTSTDQDSYVYDPNTGRMTQWTFQVGSTPATETGVLHWNPNGTLNNLVITDGFNAAGTQTCYFNPSSGTGMGYDDLGRLLNDNCSSAWAQTFSYDQYDNLTKSGSVTWNPGYSASTNQYTCAHCTYDASGNVTDDSFKTYAWDPFNKLLSVSSTDCGTNGDCATYDAFGRMVEFSKDASYTENWYTQAGSVVMTGTTLAHAYLGAPGGGTFLEYGGATDYLHKDWLGNARIASLISAQTVGADMAYAPYGEVYNFVVGSGGDWMFTGDVTQLVSEYLFDTPNREFASSNQGRWISPDPAGAGWNQYAYSTNPNSNVDPSGLAAGRLCPPVQPLGTCSNAPGVLDLPPGAANFQSWAGYFAWQDVTAGFGPAAFGTVGADGGDPGTGGGNLCLCTNDLFSGVTAVSGALPDFGPADIGQMPELDLGNGLFGVAGCGGPGIPCMVVQQDLQGMGPSGLIFGGPLSATAATNYSIYEQFPYTVVDENYTPVESAYLTEWTALLPISADSIWTPADMGQGSVVDNVGIQSTQPITSASPSAGYTGAQFFTATMPGSDSIYVLQSWVIQTFSLNGGGQTANFGCGVFCANAYLTNP